MDVDQPNLTQHRPVQPIIDSDTEDEDLSGKDYNRKIRSIMRKMGIDASSITACQVRELTQKLANRIRSGSDHYRSIFNLDRKVRDRSLKYGVTMEEAKKWVIERAAHFEAEYYICKVLQFQELEEEGDDINSVSVMDLCDREPSHPHAIPIDKRIPSRFMDPNTSGGRRWIETGAARNWYIFKDHDSETEDDDYELADRSYVFQRDINHLTVRNITGGGMRDRKHVSGYKQFDAYYTEDMGAQFLERYRKEKHTHMVKVKSSVWFGNASNSYQDAPGRVMSKGDLEFEDDDDSPLAQDPGVRDRPQDFRVRAIASGIQGSYYYSTNRPGTGAVALPGPSFRTIESDGTFHLFQMRNKETIKQEISALKSMNPRRKAWRINSVLGPHRFGFVRHPARHFPLLSQDDAVIMEQVVGNIDIIHDVLETTLDSMHSTELICMSDPISELADQVIREVLAESETEEPAGSHPTSTPVATQTERGVDQGSGPRELIFPPSEDITGMSPINAPSTSKSASTNTSPKPSTSKTTPVPSAPVKSKPPKTTKSVTRSNSVSIAPVKGAPVTRRRARAASEPASEKPPVKKPKAPSDRGRGRGRGRGK